jgi:hypothetical protein
VEELESWVTAYAYIQSLSDIAQAPLLHLAYIADNFHACSVSMPYFGFCLF